MNQRAVPGSQAGKRAGQCSGHIPKPPCNGNRWSWALSTPEILWCWESTSFSFFLILAWAGSWGCGTVLPSCIGHICPLARAQLGAALGYNTKGRLGYPKSTAVCRHGSNHGHTSREWLRGWCHPPEQGAELCVPSKAWAATLFCKGGSRKRKLIKYPQPQWATVVL